MRVSWATEAVPGRDWPNEDFVVAAEGAVVVLDGCSLPPGTELGCGHGTAWYARTLGLELLDRLLEEPPGRPEDRGERLRPLLARSIGAVAARHDRTCDLGHPATPAATVVAVREYRGAVEHLVLADSTLLLDSGDSLEVVSTAQARRYAAADPGAAEYAVTGARPAGALRRAALLTDGATRLTDRFRLLGWQDLMGVLGGEGPGELLRRTRESEFGDPHCRRWPRHKRHDDATAALCVF